MEPTAALQSLALALALGLLVGVERGWSARDAAAGTRVAGFRTFGLLGLAGGLSALLPAPFAAVVLGGAAGLVLIGYLRASEEPRSRSATSALAALITIGLGYFAAAGHRIEALATAAVMLLLLSLRHQSHRLLRGLTEAEVDAVARFAILALVILPLMPDADLGPLDAWNPRRLWFVVVLVSGISFLGYVAARRLGPERGLIATAAVAALVSSTAVTAAYARKLRDANAPDAALVAGIAVANTVMFARVLLVTGLLAPFAVGGLAAIILPAALVQGGFAAVALKRADGRRSAHSVALGNPLDVRPALLLVVFVAVLAVASRWLLDRFGGAGVGLLLLLTGFADVDAAIITLAGLPRTAIAPDLAGLLLALPVLANTGLKAGLALIIAPGRAGWRAAMPLLASLGIGLAALALLWRFGLA